MPRSKTVFICQQCGYEAPKWLGKCPNCGEWNSLAETLVSAKFKVQSSKFKVTAKPQTLSEIKLAKQPRIITGMAEFDRVLGGGIVPGSVILIAGEPGIGKSTLLLQLSEAVSSNIKTQNSKVLYISGEESLVQIKIRAQRLGVKNEKLVFLAETDADVIVEVINQLSVVSCKLVIVDSIQTLTSDDFTGTAGSIGQVRECASKLLRIAKSLGIPLFLVGHVTKEGAIAGPKILEHLVDTVVYIEGERYGAARLLRATKNRFGATDEVGVFEMTDKGMFGVDNPSKLFLAQRQKNVPGSVVVATMEGSRPVLAEIQALVVPTQLVIPRRIGQGIDFHRLQVTVAVLTKRLGLPLGGYDIYVNAAGGLRILEPAADLGIALAIWSSFKNVAVDAKTVVLGELGLLGEIREVTGSAQRAKEARRLGFSKIISPENCASITAAAHLL